MKVKTVPIAELALDPNNARKHSEKNLSAIANSLSKFGQRKPIVVRGFRVLAGNGTLEAAKSLGWTEIQVAEAPEDWDDETAKAYALADNRTAELAEWDESVLAKQLLELQDKDWNIEDIGFDAMDMPQDDAWSEAFEKASSEQKPFTQMTFILSPEQAEQVRQAIEAAKAMGDFIDTGNDNANGNALARVAETFLTKAL